MLVIANTLFQQHKRQSTHGHHQIVNTEIRLIVFFAAENGEILYSSVLYCAYLCMKCSLGVSNFLEEISSLSHSIIFLYFFALIAEVGFLISPCYSLDLCIQMGISFLFSFPFCFSSFLSYLQGLLRPPFCLFTFIFIGDGLDHCLLYNVMNLHP